MGTQNQGEINPEQHKKNVLIQIVYTQQNGDIISPLCKYFTHSSDGLQ